MTARGAQPLFIDTGAYFARQKQDDECHARATAVFRSLRAGELGYQPLYTSEYVLGELLTLVSRKIDRTTAAALVDNIYTADSFHVLPATSSVFERAYEEFTVYDDRQISFTDHTSSVLAKERGIDHVFTFDQDDFRTLGFTVVPDDTGEIR